MHSDLRIDQRGPKSVSDMNQEKHDESTTTQINQSMRRANVDSGVL